jgi:hypothetical protein
VLYYAVSGEGAFLRSPAEGLDQRLHVNEIRDPGSAILVQSRSHPSVRATRLADAIGIHKTFRLGSLGLKFIAEGAQRASAALADLRGAFPAWEGSLFAAQRLPVRKATRTAIGPTGTLGILAGTSPGIEPLFALAFRREGVLSGETIVETSPLLEEMLAESGLEAGRIVAEVLEKGRLGEVEGVPENLKRLLVTALEIPPDRHLQIQLPSSARWTTRSRKRSTCPTMRPERISPKPTGGRGSSTSKA